MEEEKERQEKTGWWGRGEAEKGEWHVPCATVSVLCQLPLTLEPKGEAPEAAGACNAGGKAYPRPSGEPVATRRQDNRVPGAPGTLSSEPPTRILLSPAQSSQHLIFYKAEERRSMPRQVNRRCLTKLPSTFATECRQARHPTPCCSAVLDQECCTRRGL